MRYPAGNSQEVVVEMAGRPHSIWGYAAGGADHPENKITVHSVTYIKRTPTGAGRDYGPVGQPGYPAITVFDTDRPGPVTVADDVVVARLIVSCPVPFNLFAA
jgi:hypothetical protein